MKIYMELLQDAAAKHLGFLLDHWPAVFYSLLVGLGIWALEFANVYLFNDYRYLAWLGLMMLYNAISGVRLANYLHRTDPQRFGEATAKVFKEKTFSKLLYYMIVLNSVHILTHFTVGESRVGFFDVFQYTILTTMMVTEFYSVHENFKRMGKKTFLEAIYNAVKDYLPTKKTTDAGQ